MSALKKVKAAFEGKKWRTGQFQLVQRQPPGLRWQKSRKTPGRETQEEKWKKKRQSRAEREVQLTDGLWEFQSKDENNITASASLQRRQIHESYQEAI